VNHRVRGALPPVKVERRLVGDKGRQPLQTGVVIVLTAPVGNDGLRRWRWGDIHLAPTEIHLGVTLQLKVLEHHLQFARGEPLLAHGVHPQPTGPAVDDQHAAHPEPYTVVSLKPKVVLPLLKVHTAAPARREVIGRNARRTAVSPSVVRAVLVRHDGRVAEQSLVRVVLGPPVIGGRGDGRPGGHRRRRGSSSRDGRLRRRGCRLRDRCRRGPRGRDGGRCGGRGGRRDRCGRCALADAQAHGGALQVAVESVGVGADTEHDAVPRRLHLRAGAPYFRDAQAGVGPRDGIDADRRDHLRGDTEPCREHGPSGGYQRALLGFCRQTGVHGGGPRGDLLLFGVAGLACAPPRELHVHGHHAVCRGRLLSPGERGVAGDVTQVGHQFLFRELRRNGIPLAGQPVHLAQVVHLQASAIRARFTVPDERNLPHGRGRSNAGHV